MENSNAPEPKNIVILSPRTEDTFHDFKNEFLNAFPSFQKQMVFSLYTPAQPMDTWTKSIEVPTLVLVDQGKINAEKSLSYWKPIFGALKKLDNKLPILLFSDQIPAGKDAMLWFDTGCNGLLNIKFKASDLSESLQEILHRRLEGSDKNLS